MKNTADTKNPYNIPNDMVFTQMFLQPKTTEEIAFGQRYEEILSTVFEQLCLTGPQTALVMFAVSIKELYKDIFARGMDPKLQKTFLVQLFCIGFEAGTQRVEEFNLVKLLSKPLIDEGLLVDNIPEVEKFVGACLLYAASFKDFKDTTKEDPLAGFDF